MKVLWQLTTTYACARVTTRHGVIVEAAPIYRRYIGQRLVDVREKLWDSGRFVKLQQVGPAGLCVKEENDQTRGTKIGGGSPA